MSHEFPFSAFDSTCPAFWRPAVAPAHYSSAGFAHGNWPVLLDPVYSPKLLNGAVVRRSVMTRIHVLFPELRVSQGGVAALVLESPDAGNPAGG